METEVGLRKEFKQIPEEHRSRSTGVAALRSQVSYVFIDATVSIENLDFGDMCWLCDFCCYCRPNVYVTGFCKKGIEPLVELCVQKINSVTVHELLHLCGCDETQAREVECAIYPDWWDCNSFSHKIINLIEL